MAAPLAQPSGGTIALSNVRLPPDGIDLWHTGPDGRWNTGHRIRMWDAGAGRMLGERIVAAEAGAAGTAFGADKVILFGSQSRGRAGPDSDVDLLVVMPVQGESFRQAAKILSVTRAPFPLDVIVRSRRSVRQRLAMGDCLMRDVIERGVVYEAQATRGRVGRQGGGRLPRHATRIA